MLRQMMIQTGKGYTLPYPAASWEEGMLLGNGKMGAVVFGEGEGEKIILSQEYLYAPVDENLTPIPMAEKLPIIRELLDRGDSSRATDLIVQMFREKEGLEEKIWTNPFFPAGNLSILTEECGIYRNYERTLTFASGEGKVCFTASGNRLERRYVLSRADDCLAVFLNSEKPANYEISLSQTPYVKNGMHVNKKMFAASGGNDFFIPEIILKEEGMEYQCGYRERKQGYGITLHIGCADGKLEKGTQKLLLKNCRQALLLVSVIPLKEICEKSALDAEEERFRKISRSGKNAEEVYRKILKRHEKIHRERYERISLELENKHLETMFQAGRYEILSSCGETPPNLQGVWCGTYDTPWSSDYTQNGNLQTAILGLLPSGDFESMRSYFDYQERMLSDYRENSRILYGCRGIHIPSRTSDCGVDFHFDQTWPMVFWTAGAAWAAHFYFEYWLYTGDDEFFKNRALPFMREAALFYEDYLYEDENGYWKFSPSYSPENTPSNKENAACINATMDLSIAKELFSNLIIGCRTLGILEEEAEHWEKFLEKMPPYLINQDGALKEWAHPEYEEEYDHRHSSHLYMLYYDLPKEESAEILEAAKKAYEIKMERKKKEQGTMAFGLVQAGMAAAHLGDSKMAGTMIQSMAENNYYRTYASSHDFGPSIFNADISGGIPALMIECLIQCSVLTDEHKKISGYEIRLLPALPENMKSGKITGVHLRGGFLADLIWKDRKLISFHIENPKNQVYQIKEKVYE